ncbi:hypothetical protein SEPCBS119000_002261 [Sporothrix epigloea]|uniref:5'-hydroxyaverantin dehydrogenase n=1 Tax=Sporothrix epigloea TaxID=1892477 RepID=A0ABP0DGY3_9PEZI
MAVGETPSFRETIRQSPRLDPKAPYDTSSVAGKTILITGGASGFGAAFARRWAALGAHVAIGDINDEGGEALVAELRATTSGGQYHHYVHCDVTKWESQVAFFQAAVQHSANKCIHVVVPNAGIADTESPANGRGFENPAPFRDADGVVDESRGPAAPRMPVIDVNLTGVLYSVHLAMYWLPRNDGKDRHILLLSSMAGLMGLPGQALYSTSKHAVTGMFRALRGTAHVHNGLRVNMLCPYFVDTPIMSKPGLVLLAGSGLATTADVVEAGTRFVADESIAGRALVIGPKMLLKSVDGKAVGSPDDTHSFDMMASPEGGIQFAGEPTAAQIAAGDDQAIWECYADDYETCEAFTNRYVRLLNALTAARGWTGYFLDLYNVFVKGRPAAQPKNKRA